MSYQYGQMAWVSPHKLMQWIPFVRYISVISVCSYLTGKNIVYVFTNWSKTAYLKHFSAGDLISEPQRTLRSLFNVFVSMKNT